MPRISIIGPMGVGKSTIGRGIAEQIRYPFLDLDDYIIEQHNRDIPSLFRTMGEAAFRKLEYQALAEIYHSPSYRDCVLATGGGTVVTSDARELLRDSWHVIFLNASTDTLVAHITQDRTERPLLLQGGSIADRISTIMKQRKHWYESLADLIFSVDRKSIVETVNTLTDILRTRNYI